MADQLNLSDLASVFQLAAGVSLAMSVFRSPYEHLYHRLGAILDREEIILEGRHDAAALAHADNVTQARVAWLTKGRELEPIIRAHELWIWAAVLLSCALLAVASLWPNFHISRSVGLLCLCAVAGPLLWGAGRIYFDVRGSLSQLKAEVEAL